MNTIKKSLFFIMLCYLALSAGCSNSTESISADDLLNTINSDHAPLILDVRTPREYVAGHVPGAINIPHTELEQRLAEIKMYIDTPVVVYCKSGRRAGIAEELLLKNDFSQLRHLKGDMDGWLAGDYPVEK